MTNELIRLLTLLTLGSSVGIIAALLLRGVARLAFGSLAAYCTWLIVLVAMAAVVLPHAHRIRPALAITLQFESFSALSYMLDAPAAPPAAAGSSVAWQALIIDVWCAGVLMFTLYLAALQRAFVRSLGTLSGSRCILRAERSAGCPALLGVFRPKVVLPADFNLRYTRLERILILAHERTHLRRGDGAWNAIAALLRCLFWFNPLVHIALIYFRFDQELACDAAVLKNEPRSRGIYASAMLKTQLADAELPVGCHWQSAQHFKERLQMIKKAIPGRGQRTCGYVCVAVANLAVGYSAWAAEPPTITNTAVVAPVSPNGSIDTSSSNSIRVSGDGLTVEDFGNTTRVRGPKLKLTFDRPIHLQLQADAVMQQSGGIQVLDGHVRITAQVVHVVLAGTRVLTSEIRAVVVNAESAVLTPQPGGGVAVNVENGSVQL